MINRQNVEKVWNNLAHPELFRTFALSKHELL